MWLNLFSGREELINMALSKGAKKIQKAYEKLQYLSKDEKARQEYDEYKEAEIIARSEKTYSKLEGIEIGIKKRNKRTE